MGEVNIDLDLGFIALITFCTLLVFKDEIRCKIGVENACAAIEKSYIEENKLGVTQ